MYCRNKCFSMNAGDAGDVLGEPFVAKERFISAVGHEVPVYKKLYRDRVQVPADVVQAVLCECNNRNSILPDFCDEG